MIFLAIAVVLLLLVGSEAWWRHRKPHGEFSRKFVHITVGSFVATWPYFLSANEIRLLALAFLIGVCVSRRLNIFSAIHSVQRPTIGEFWFAVVVGLLSLIDNQPHIYSVSLLMMSLADGLAAIVGVRYGKRNFYTVFGSQKSVVGTLTFFVVALGLLVWYQLISPGMVPWAALFPIAVGATLIENVGVQGIDNLLVPLFVAGSLLLFV